MMPNLPAEQPVHTLARTAELKVPDVQPEHVLIPDEDAKLPTAQFTHTLGSQFQISFEYVPKGHLKHSMVPFKWHFPKPPIGHTLQITNDMPLLPPSPKKLNKPPKKAAKPANAAPMAVPTAGIQPTGRGKLG